MAKMMKKLVEELLGLKFDVPIIYCDFYDQTNGRSNLCRQPLKAGSIVVAFNTDLQKHSILRLVTETS